MLGPDAERLASRASRRTMSVLKLANMCSGNSKQQCGCVSASQCRCIAVRTIQPAVHHHYHHETTRPTIQRHSRPDRTQLSDSPLTTSLLRSLTKQHTQPSAHRQTSSCSVKRLYIIEMKSAALKEMLTLLPNFIPHVSVKHTNIATTCFLRLFYGFIISGTLQVLRTK